LALKKNQKYCFGELGNTTGQHSTAQHKTAQHAKLRQASPSFWRAGKHHFNEFEFDIFIFSLIQSDLFLQDV
jgi:hypothetical protein